ncbi:MAG: hypothetical protein IKS36_00385 [Bacteroidales bacterium]|nr:hypothetical protein [Bacteroidales bacterium]
MKAIYIRPETEIVNLYLQKDINWGEHGEDGGQSANVTTANEADFFDDGDDDRDPFFDD